MTTQERATGAKAIEAAFSAAKDEGRSALITYLTLGYPMPADTPELVMALQTGGADLIELGVPFSDPVADGPTIQAASQAALAAGMTPARCLDMVRVLREQGITAPLVLMGYYNPILSYGLSEYVRHCHRAGVDGLIVPDLSPEEAGPLRAACQEHGVALVCLVGPTSGEERVAKIAAQTEGFLYVISRLGITGSGSAPGVALHERLRTVRQYATTPVAVGFGISNPEQVRALARDADGIIVGSAVVERAVEGPQRLREFVASLRAALY